MNLRRLPLLGAILVSLVLGWGGRAYAGTATDIVGLYYTGVSTGGSLLAGGAKDPHWTVTYASTNGGSSQNSTYKGAAYVVDNTNVVGSGWTQNTTSSQWIVAPGAQDPNDGSSVNTGGDFLPGNGTSGSNSGVYVYTLAFTITGTGSGTVKNAVSIGLTISADDNYKVYVNPSGNGTTLPTGTAAASGSASWDNTATATLYNGTDGTGTSGNSVFKIGTNYLTIVVTNSNSVNGSSSSTSPNASGLLVYQVGSALTINGHPIPEEGTLLPLFAAVGLYATFAWRRRRQRTAPAA